MNKMAKKQDIADKVKEIKQRQHNWLKERAAIKQKQDVPSKSLSAHPSHTVTNSSVRKSAPTVDYRKSSYPLPENVIASTKSNAKFQNWLQAKGGKDTDDRHRNAQHGNKSYNSNNYSSYQEGDNHGNVGCHSEVDILRVSSSRSPQYATPDIGWNSDDETGEITAAQLMSPEDFDAVADDIIARVKGDISAKDGGAEKFTSEGSNGKLSSHVCPNCEHLMVPPQHNPMLLIPCGHTLCRMCTKKTKYCCVCGCPVQSTTDNATLQQIITDFQSQERAKKEEKQRNRKMYKEEYHNLLTRQEILQQESATISKNISKLKSQLTKEKQQIESISKEEENIQYKIRALQQQRQVLLDHKREYERNYEEIGKTTEAESDRLFLIKDSLKSIQEKIDKVKLLAEFGE